MEECFVWLGVLALCLILNWTLDIHYFLRMGLCVLNARLFKKKSHILDCTSITGICLTTDVDTLLYHMNNARYLREIDFARADFYERTKLYSTIRAKGGAVVQGACTIRYRRFIRPFSRFIITSKILWWDQNSIFMEHRFVSPKDEFVRAIAVCRQRLIKVSAEDVMSEMLARDPERGPQKPECPLEILRWLEANEISSANLRNGC